MGIKLRKDTEDRLAETVDSAVEIVAGIALVATLALLVAGVALVLAVKASHA